MCLNNQKILADGSIKDYAPFTTRSNYIKHYNKCKEKLLIMENMNLKMRIMSLQNQLKNQYLISVLK